MAFWVWIGLIFGGVVGGLGGGLFGAVLLGGIGAGVGVLIARSMASSPARDGSAPPPQPRYGEVASTEPFANPAVDVPATRNAMPATLSGELLRRLDALDARLARIEMHLAGRGGAVETAPAAAEPAVPAELVDLPLIVPPPVIAPELSPLEPVHAAASPVALTSITVTPAAESAPPLTVAADGTMQPALRESDGASPAVEGTRAIRPDVPPSPPPRPDYGAPSAAEPAEPSALWRWLTGGNALTRVGIVILFFGVAFLLRYFAEIVTIPIELKLAGAGAGGVLLAILGVVLARARPAYGLSLQGAGMGIVYLTVFAAFRLYQVLAPAPAIALLVIVAATTVVLALRHDSQPLAALALAGGFLAPVLIRTQIANPVLLFGYCAILNAAIFAIAWKRAWRPLNVLGFVFTFALGLAWGWRYYTPAHYASIQPFLALFFLFYVGIAILYARREPLKARAAVDGIIVFGVPIVGFALQMAIVHGYRYGVAWSAGAVAAFYGLLWLALRTRAEPGLALLARSFAVLAVMFATLAIPFAADPRATSAWWAIEAAAVYWLGAVQRQPLARVFALLLQVAAGVYFLADLPGGTGRLFLNASFLGGALIGLAGLATAWAGDRYRDALDPREKALEPWVFAWGAVWWLAAGVDEVRRQLPHPAHIDAALAWVVVTTGVALALARALHWPRLNWIAAALLPAMGAAAYEDLRAVRTTLTHFGWIVWPIAWGLQWVVLRAGEVLHQRADDTTQAMRVRSDFLALAHTVSAVALVAWLSWEASEWAGRHTDPGSVWIACAAALPAILYLFAVLRAFDRERWPVADYPGAYCASAGTTVAALLIAWFAIVNGVSPGHPAPLPYLPLLNPLDLTVIAALCAVLSWARVWARVDARTLYGWLGLAVFVALNGAVVRTAHHWGDIPWRWASLMAYKPLQAALTLTWTATALALMLWATKKGVRAAWMVGAGLLAAVVVKLFALDLAALAGLTRVIAFMGVGALLLVIGYVAPLPPSADAASDAKPRS